MRTQTNLFTSVPRSPSTVPSTQPPSGSEKAHFLADPVFTPNGMLPAEWMRDLMEMLLQNSASGSDQHQAALAIEALLYGSKPPELGDSARQLAADLLLDYHQHRLLAALAEACPGHYVLKVGSDQGKAETLQRVKNWPETAEVRLDLTTPLAFDAAEILIGFLQQVPAPRVHLSGKDPLLEVSDRLMELLARPDMGEMVFHGAVDLVAFFPALARHGSTYGGVLTFAPLQACFVVPEKLSARGLEVMSELIDMLKLQPHRIPLRHRPATDPVEGFRAIHAELEGELQKLGG